MNAFNKASLYAYFLLKLSLQVNVGQSKLIDIIEWPIEDAE